MKRLPLLPNKPLKYTPTCIC